VVFCSIKTMSPWFNNLTFWCPIGILMFLFVRGLRPNLTKFQRLRRLLPVFLNIFTTYATRLLYRRLESRSLCYEVVISYFYIAFLVMLLSFERGRLNSEPIRLLVDIPASFYSAVATLSLPFALFIPVHYVLLVTIPIGVFGTYQSLKRNPFEVHHLVLDKHSYPKLTKIQGYNVKTSRQIEESTTSNTNDSHSKVLRICQISDPHLGPFMPVKKLRAICETIVDNDPDLVVLTGDFFTVQGHEHPDALLEALSPLKQIHHKTVACLGNHDYEILSVIKETMRALRIPLLVDNELILETRIGKVQIIGADFYFWNVQERIDTLVKKCPRSSVTTATILLLHNPFHFKRIPNGYADITLSGHLHGGQLGLLSFGLDITVFSIARLFGHEVPEQGFWGFGKYHSLNLELIPLPTYNKLTGNRIVVFSLNNKLKIHFSERNKSSLFTPRHRVLWISSPFWCTERGMFTLLPFQKLK